MSRFGEEALVKIPVPPRLLEISDETVRRQALKDWWHGYALRYPDYQTVRMADGFMYMARKE